MQKNLLTSPAGSSGIARRLSMGRKIRVLAAGLLVAGGMVAARSAQAQTTIINEGFESGLNGWTLVNGSEVNKWFIGSATFASGANSAYIDNGTGATNIYTVTTASVTHLYRDVTFPAGQGVIQFTFKWKAQGEGTGSNDWDNLKVFASDPATAVTAGLEMPAADKIGANYYNFSSGTGYTTTSILLPASYAGTTKRIVFSWKNDNAFGTQPPVSVDDILLTSRVISPLNGTYTIDNTLTTSGNNFANFTDAISRLNLDGITGPVTFNVAAGQSFPEDGLIITYSGSAANPVIFQKSGTGANPMIRPTGTSAATDAGITLSGADFITFDGIDINVATGTAVEFGYLIRNASATNGAINNTIRNASITLNRSNTNSIGILQSSSASFGAALSPISFAGTNQNNTYTNNAIQSVYNGILLVAGNGLFPDNNAVVSNNTIGGATAGDLGGGATAAYGIKTTMQGNTRIFGNEVRNITTTTATVDGIFADQVIGLTEIFNNKVNTLRNSNNGSTSNVTGIRLNTYTSSTGNIIRAYNNFIYGLTHAFNGTATGSRRLIGIFAQSNGSGVGNTLNIDFNSVRMESQATFTASSTAFEIGTTSGPIINVRNNIFADFTAAQTGLAKHYTWVSTSGTLTGIAGSVSDFNLLHISNTTNGFIGLSNATDRTTLAAWRTAMNQDFFSKTTNPQFISATDLHINTSVPTEVESGGSYFNGAITWINTDIDAQTRNTNTPDLGADEGTFQVSDFTAPSIQITPLLSNTSSTANRTVIATITDVSGVPTTGTLIPRIYFSKGGTTFFSAPGTLTSGTATNGTWSFTINNATMGGVANGDRIFYFVIAQDVNNFVSTSPTTGIIATDVNTVTTITSAWAYYINASIASTITVPGTYPSLTNAGGLFEAINNGVLTGNVNVLITADLTAEAGTFGLNQWVEEGAGNYTLSIRPDAAINRTISGTVATAGLGLVRLSGADRVTIDGSFNGNGRFLTIINTAIASTPIALQVVNASVNNVIRNLNLSTGTNEVTSYGFVSNGVNNSNLVFENNSISKALIGILIQGDATTPHTGLIIKDNRVGSTVVADYITIKGMVISQAPGTIITGNNIFNIKTSTIGADNAGIEMGTNSSNSIINRNTITGLRQSFNDGWGSWGIVITSTNTSNILISNNMISDIMTVNYNATSTQYNAFGIRITGGINHKIYNNSINMFGTTNINAVSPVAPLTAGLVVTASTVLGLEIRNNVIANSMTSSLTGSKNYAIYLASSVSVNTLNNNNYFLSGPSAFTGYLNSDRLTLSDWKIATGKEQNSVAIDPMFVSPTDLHITATNTTMDNLGVPVAEVAVDFDNQNRNSVTPDMGADEFGPLALPTVTAGGPTTFCSGGSVLLTAASTLPGVTYQWQLNGSPITGATSATFTANASGIYTVVTTESGNSSTSAATTVTANPIPATPTITAGGSTSLCTGGSVALTGASTTSGATYQWLLNGTPISGATSAVYNANAAGNYTVIASLAGNPCTSTSTATAVSVNAVPATPSVTAGGATTFCAGGSVTLTASSATSGATYQWLLNGTPISGATSATYAATTSGSYTALALSATCSSPASTATTVTANSGAATPTITAGGPTSFCTGGSVVLTAASTTTGVTYQWYQNGTLISGATSPTYTANASGNYTAVAAASGCPSFASAPTAVTVTTTPTTPTITAGGATTFCSGGSVTLTAASSTGATFQWKLNGTNITGATSATYAANAAGAYTVVASSGTCSSPVSATTTVTVNTTPATPTLTTGGPVSFCSGGSVNLTAASATSGATYQWLLNGTPISGATSATYAATTAGNYTAIATLGTCSSVASAATAVTVTTTPTTPTITAGGATTFCSGGSVTLTAASSTGATFQWKLNGTNITGATNATYAANAAGAYTVVASSGTCSSPVSATTTVTVNTTPATPTLTTGGPVSFCSGGSVNLTAASATSGVTYQWLLNGTPISGATSATYAATTAGNYTAIATLGTCSSVASAATAVTVNATPATPTITAGGATTFCTGGSVVLTGASTTTGVTYQWLLNGTAITGATSATYTANAAGNYTVRVSGAGSCTSTSAQTTVTVTSAAAVPTLTAGGPVSFCTGGSVTLTATSATTGATYTWFLNGSPIAGATSATYTANAAGNYTAVATATGCPSAASAATAVTVNAPAALPTIAAGGPTTFCAGGSVALTAASTTTGATYTWFLNGTPITGATSATYTANAAGNYTAVATANGCPSAASAGTTVTVNALPATPTIAQNGGVLTSSAATGNQWYLNGILIPGATGQNYTTAANGAYTVITTGTNGCASTASAVKNVTNTGLNAALAEMGIQVYPNPNNGSFNVKLTGYQKDATITLYNLAGQLIATETVKAANTDQNVKAMNLKGLAAGTYLLKVMSDKGTQVTRLVVE